MLDVHKDGTCPFRTGVYLPARACPRSFYYDRDTHTFVSGRVRTRGDERVFYSYFIFLFRSCFIFGRHESEKALLFNIRRGKSTKKKPSLWAARKTGRLYSCIFYPGPRRCVHKYSNMEIKNGFQTKIQ